jgi:predicted RecB family endonuclease
MRVVLENVEPKYLAVLNELAEALRFTVSASEADTKRTEIDRRIRRLESREATLIRPDWQKITAEAAE